MLFKICEKSEHEIVSEYFINLIQVIIIYLLLIKKIHSKNSRE